MSRDVKMRIMYDVTIDSINLKMKILTFMYQHLFFCHNLESNQSVSFLCHNAPGPMHTVFRTLHYSASLRYNFAIVYCDNKIILTSLNTLRLRQNGRHFPDGIFKWIFLNGNIWILIKISLKFVLRGSINNIPALVQIMAWCRLGNKPLSELMMA